MKEMTTETVYNMFKDCYDSSAINFIPKLLAEHTVLSKVYKRFGDSIKIHHTKLYVVLYSEMLKE